MTVAQCLKVMARQGLATARPVGWSGDEEVRENNKGAKQSGIVFILHVGGGYGRGSAPS